MSQFRVALSSDFRKPDGSPAYPMFDLTPLSGSAIEYTYLTQDSDGEVKGAELEDFDALILLGHRFSPASVPNNARLAIVARFGVGFDTVDIPACNEQAIALVTTPDGVRRPVAVSIMTFILALAGKLFIKDKITRMGAPGWAQRSDYMGIGLVDKTLGVIGIGNIGAELFRLAKPFDMKFIAHDPFANKQIAQELGVELVGLEELFQRADFVSVNCPLNEQTHGLVNAERLALMKPTAFLINTSRGPVVDEQAITQVLQERRIAGAGLDVFEQEPSSADNPLFQLDNVIVAPHSLCWTDQCFAGIGAADVRAVLEIMHGRKPVGVVNREILENQAWLDKLAGYQARFGD